ncbi:extracellular solute-binding protein [Paenibacillus sp. J5C_2022]|uniref:extracellular solute-binding protein n=1 Tax=Paenibacillus sp. J5C2022 TaxID=2977129 RepID=UPI0021D0AEEC|nr:extracellular solute-binding protein [Paenibacillus sp. J5C2022]MCU6711800.1 extracellular solute-binding protein [Paenibacillus sp. J5C2022]
MSRKLVPLLLALTLIVGILAACSGGNNDGNKNGGTNEPPKQSTGNNNPGETKEPEADPNKYGDTGGLKLPIVDKPTTISMYVASDAQDLNEKWVAKELEERTGIKVDFQFFSTATYKDKMKVTLASGKLPDIIHGLTVPEINEMGGAGAFVAINDYIDELPNFKKLYVEENGWVMKSYSDDEGKMYTWPIYGLNREVNHGFLYRKDIFDKNNIPMWTNTEEFYQALKQLKEIYPDSFPFASKTKEFIFRDWGYGWGVTGDNYPMNFDEAAHQWEYSFTQPEYREMLDFMKKLYQEGLLDPEFLTDTSASWSAKMTANDKAFVTFDWIGRLDLFYNQIKEQSPDYNLRYANPVGPENTIRSLPQITMFGHAVANNKNKEVALKLLDYLTSPSGAELMTMGEQGDNYEFDANGKVSYPELKDVELIEIKALEEKYGMWVQGAYVRTDHRSVYYNFTEKEQEAQDMMKDMKQPLDPVLKFTDEENSTIADVTTELLKAGEEFSSKYIFTASYGDKEWEEWKAKAKSLGEDDYVGAYNDAQARFDSE